MPRRLFTAEDVRRLAHEKAGILVLAQDDILTQEAAETALALGIKVLRGPGSPPSRLPPLKVVHLAGIQMDPFLEGKATPGTNVWFKDVLAGQDGSPLLAGYISLDKGEMQRTLAHDEIDIVLEGELLVRRGSEQVRGRPGDLIYISRGSNITIGTPGWTRFAYVAWPASQDEK